MSEIAQEAVDLDEFTQLGKVPWEDRAALIRKRFPNIDTFNWAEALQGDIDLFGRTIRDILKLEQAVPGRPGPRPSLDVPAATKRLQQLFGEDYTIKPFPEALRSLAGDRSLRHIASVTKLNKDCIDRLLKGKTEPDGYHMKMCAEAFGKHPSYFLEWRMLYITQAIMRRLEWSPETTVDLFKTLDRQRKVRA